MLIKCHLCNKKFQHADDVCTISSRVYNETSISFETLLVGLEENEGLVILKEVNFHTSCFIEIAGEERVP